MKLSYCVHRTTSWPRGGWRMTGSAWTFRVHVGCCILSAGGSFPKTYIIFITEGGVRGGRESCRVGLYGGLADDGKRSQAVDVLYQCRRQHFLLFIYIFIYRGGVRGGEDRTGSGGIRGWRISVWTFKMVKNSSVFVCFCYIERSGTLSSSLGVSLELQRSL